MRRRTGFKAKRYANTQRANGINPKIKRHFDRLVAEGADRDEALQRTRQRYGFGAAR